MSMDDMLNRRRTETENWRLTEFYCNSLLDQCDKASTSEQYTLSLWPFLNPYFSPLNPIYTPVFQTLCAQGLRAVNEKQLPVWMLRDGAVPLTWFFSKHKPELVEGQILVHADLKNLVPESWTGKVASYRHRTHAATDCESLLIVGPISERVISIDELDAKIESIEASIGKRKMSTMSVRLYCPIRGEGESFPARYLQKIYSAFRRVDIIDWYDVENIGSLKGVGFIELNNGWLFKDSYVQQHALSRGASLIGQDKLPAKKSRYVPLSRFHGVSIEPFVPKARTSFDKDRRLEKFFIQSSRLIEDEGVSGPWPKWHEKWCRAMFQSKKRS